MPKQKSRRPHPPRSCPLAVIDEAADCCRKIAALADLLARCEMEPLNPKTVSVSGALIVEEAEKLGQNLKRLGGSAR